MPVVVGLVADIAIAVVTYGTQPQAVAVSVTNPMTTHVILLSQCFSKCGLRLRARGARSRLEGKVKANNN